MTKERLYRSREHVIVAGVLGGIAEHLEVDPILVRLIFLLATFVTGLGPGIVIYIIAALVIPQRPLMTPSTVAPADDHSAV